MNGTPSKEDLALWREFITACNALAKAEGDLFRQASSLTQLVRAGLNKPTERASAIRIVTFLDESERKELFPDLLSLASYVNGVTTYAKDLVLGLPREWVSAHIQETADGLLRDGTDEEYRAMWEIYKELDMSLASELAKRAANDSDPEIKRAGEEFLRSLRRP